MKFHRATQRAMFCICLFASSAALAVVCRENSVAGYGSRMDSVKAWIGESTSDITKMKIYLSQGMRDGKRELYVHSNFLSTDPTNGDAIVAFPTKLVEGDGKVKSLSQLFLNLIFLPDADGNVPENADTLVAQATKNAEVFIDPDIMADDGRIAFDLSGVKQIALARDNGRLELGEISTLILRKPPPIMMERLSGCCLSGRPAGRGLAIKRSFEQTKFNPKEVGLLSLVVDSATADRIATSGRLEAAAKRGQNYNQGSWESKISAALAANKGRSLIVLSHVSKGNVVIEGPSGTVEHRLSIDQLHEMAAAQQVNLVLVGCDTLAQAQSLPPGIGIVGRYNTEHAARQLDQAMSNSKNALEFVENLASEGLHIVVQEGAWSQNGLGATVYAKPESRLKRFKRAFRIWFLG